MDAQKDTLNTQRLSNALSELEAYMSRVAAPLIKGEAADELISLRQENAQLKQQQQTARDELDKLIQTVSQKGVEAL